jgi:hypothetical protein
MPFPSDTDPDTEVESLLAVTRRIDREAVTLQSRCEGFAQWRFIFNEQYTHGVLLPLP